MASNPEAEYRVQQVPKVLKQVDALIEQAKQAGKYPGMIDLLARIGLTLQATPEAWGDPSYRTKRAGGIGYRGYDPPLVVHYAVFAEEKVVFVLDIKAIDPI